MLARQLTDAKAEKAEKGYGMGAEAPAQRARRGLWLLLFHGGRVCVYVLNVGCRQYRRRRLWHGSLEEE